MNKMSTKSFIQKYWFNSAKILGIYKWNKTKSKNKESSFHLDNVQYKNWWIALSDMKGILHYICRKKSLEEESKSPGDIFVNQNRLRYVTLSKSSKISVLWHYRGLFRYAKAETVNIYELIWNSRHFMAPLF
jgi:hypothetical protein